MNACIILPCMHAVITFFSSLLNFAYINWHNVHVAHPRVSVRFNSKIVQVREICLRNATGVMSMTRR